MTKEEVIEILHKNNLSLIKDGQIRLPNDSGWKLILDKPCDGVIVNCFDNGTVNVQGKNSSMIAVVKQYLGI